VDSVGDPLGSHVVALIGYQADERVLEDDRRTEREYAELARKETGSGREEREESGGSGSEEDVGEKAPCAIGAKCQALRRVPWQACGCQVKFPSWITQQ
jgi:hypothetical protein